MLGVPVDPVIAVEPATPLAQVAGHGQIALLNHNAPDRRPFVSLLTAQHGQVDVLANAAVWTVVEAHTGRHALTNDKKRAFAEIWSENWIGRWKL